MNLKRNDCFILHWDVGKRNHLPYERIIMSRKKEEKIFYMNHVWVGKKVSKQHIATLKKHSFEVVPNNTSLLYATSIHNFYQNFSLISAYDQNSMINLHQPWRFCAYAHSSNQILFEKRLRLWSYKADISFPFWLPEINFISTGSDNFKGTVSV